MNYVWIRGFKLFSDPTSSSELSQSWSRAKWLGIIQMSTARPIPMSFVLYVCLEYNISFDLKKVWCFLKKIVSKSLNWTSTKWRWVGHLLYGPKASDTFLLLLQIHFSVLPLCFFSYSSFSSSSFHFFSIIINIHSVLNSTGKSEVRKAVASTGTKRDLNSLPRN